MSASEKRIILIGGAPTVGKTYLAKKLGKELRLPWISTDTIREQMRKTTTSIENAKDLFHFDLVDPVEYLNSHTAQEVVDQINLENKYVWNGVLDFIEEGSFGDSYLIEGMAVIPELVSKLARYNNKVKPIFLVDDDVDRLRDVIYTRGLWDAAFRYSDSVKGKELEWVVLCNEWIKKECLKYGMPVVETTADSDKYLQDVRRFII